MAAATGRKELAALREYAYSLVLDMAASSVESVRHREASAPGLDGVTPSCHLKATERPPYFPDPTPSALGVAEKVKPLASLAGRVRLVRDRQRCALALIPVCAGGSIA